MGRGEARGNLLTQILTIELIWYCNVLARLSLFPSRRRNLNYREPVLNLFFCLFMSRGDVPRTCSRNEAIDTRSLAYSFSSLTCCLFPLFSNLPHRRIVEFVILERLLKDPKVTNPLDSLGIAVVAAVSSKSLFLIFSSTRQFTDIQTTFSPSFRMHVCPTCRENSI